MGMIPPEILRIPEPDLGPAYERHADGYHDIATVQADSVTVRYGGGAAHVMGLPLGHTAEQFLTVLGFERTAAIHVDQIEGRPLSCLHCDTDAVNGGNYCAKHAPGGCNVA